MWDSVTVSMAALMMGIKADVARDLSLRVGMAGTTSERAGRSRTSSNVRASGRESGS